MDISSIEEIQEKNRKALEAFCKAVQEGPHNSQCGVVITVASVRDVITNGGEKWSRAALELCVCAFRAAIGEQDEQSHQCFGCQTPWTLDSLPLALALIEFTLYPGQGCLGGLCENCVGDEKILAEATQRDFGAGDFRRVMNPPEGLQ